MAQKTRGGSQEKRKEEKEENHEILRKIDMKRKCNKQEAVLQALSTGGKKTQ